MATTTPHPTLFVPDGHALQALLTTRPDEPWLAVMPAQLYHHGLEAAHSTGLGNLLRSPKHYQQGGEQTDAMVFGSAFHARMEGPDTFAAAVAVRPTFGRTKAAQAEAAEWDAANGGKLIISAKEEEQIHAMANSCARKTKLQQLLRGARSEVSGYYLHPDFGVPCKFRVDIDRSHQGIIADYKTTQDASPEAFKWSARKFNYHMQAAFYLDGMSYVTGTPVQDFLIVAVEKPFPHELNIFCLDRDDIEIGRRLYRNALAVYARCVHSGVWPGYADEIQTLKLF